MYLRIGSEFEGRAGAERFLIGSVESGVADDIEKAGSQGPRGVGAVAKAPWVLHADVSDWVADSCRSSSGRGSKEQFYFKTGFLVFWFPVAFFLLKNPTRVGPFLDPPGGLVSGSFKTK